jgi:hypothetical protein
LWSWIYIHFLEGDYVGGRKILEICCSFQSCRQLSDHGIHSVYLFFLQNCSRWILEKKHTVEILISRKRLRNPSRFHHIFWISKIHIFSSYFSFTWSEAISRSHSLARVRRLLLFIFYWYFSSLLSMRSQKHKVHTDSWIERKHDQILINPHGRPFSKAHSNPTERKGIPRALLIGTTEPLAQRHARTAANAETSDATLGS